MAERQVYAWCPIRQAFVHMYIHTGARAAQLGHGRRLITAHGIGGGGMQGRAPSATAEGNR